MQGACQAFVRSRNSVRGTRRTPAALERSEQLQLAAMTQYRDEMAAYHAKVAAQLAAEKRSQLDAALAAYLNNRRNRG